MMIPSHRSLRPCSSRRSRSGLSLIELLVVIGVIGLLVALALPAISGARARARATQCANHMRQLGVALQAHQSQYQSLPRDGQNGYGYVVYLLPHLEQSAIYDKMTPHRVAFADLAPAQRSAGEMLLEVVLCPSFASEWKLQPSGLARLSYRGNADVLDGGMDLANVLDGESTTVIAGETTIDQSWLEPGTATLTAPPNQGDFGSRHTQGAHFLMCDGAVRFIADNVDGTTFRALGTANGGDVVGSF
ncbi:hypothetical protein Mal4_39110 [Maioricimonas rarisocia]|uniref:DUF1559 domain-containing protein n=1 Tax=Maioricimonas rarisocia TaxID=2528026 RepID=A0A517ZAP1_9PLAN|nr:DUF1559 domain-containing protein [Maioricimonas rarisocia]QDU39566.1 hypothetical protein Mal4_39110 [Maioricimonas rarisocia]